MALKSQFWLGLALALAGAAAAEQPIPEKCWPDPDQLPVNLLEHFDNDGISAPPKEADGNFDCPDHPEDLPGSTFPGEHLPGTGAAVGLAVREGRIVHFLFPSKEAGEPNNVACNGQYLDVEDGRYRALWLLGSSENGHFEGEFGLNYQEGMQSIKAGLSDWCLASQYGEEAGVECPYRYAWQANPPRIGREDLTCRLWIQSIGLDAGKKLQGFSLPFQRRMHLFAATLEAAEDAPAPSDLAEDLARLYQGLRSPKTRLADEIRDALDDLRREVLEAAAGDPHERELHWLAASLDYAAERLPDRGGRVSAGLTRQTRQVMAWVRQDMGELRDGRNPFTGRRGQLLKSYYSPLDDSWQTYAVSVPDDYAGDRPYPLIVQLHGHDWYRPFQGYPAPLIAGVLVASPQGRGSIDYMLAAEEDVFRVIEEIERDYRVDPDRIILEGHSMGGTGSWNLGVKFPDRFCCLAPVAGNTDHSVWEKEFPPRRTFDESFRPLARFLQDLTDPIAYAGNLQHVPVFCVHGAQDNVVRVEHARRMVSGLRERGLSPVYREFEGVQHWGFPAALYAERWDWMMSQKRTTPPRTVSFKTARLRYPGAYWIRIDQFELWGRFAEIEASQEEDGSVHVKTSNVLGFSILPDQLPEPPKAALAVWVEGRKIFEGEAGGEFRAEKTEDAWRPASPERNLFVKRKDLEGPVGDAFLAPFILVYGTISPDPFWNWMTRSEAEALADDWQLLYRARPRIKADREITAEDVRAFNLVLFGGAERNSVSDAVVDGLPLHLLPWGDYQQDVRVSEKAGIGLKFCYLNPLNPGRYVVLCDAREPMGLWQINNRFGNWIGWGPYDNWNWFDYVVFDDWTSSPDTVQMAGFFGPDWVTQEQALWAGSVSARARAEPRRLPRWRELPGDGEIPDVLVLSDLLPARIRQHKGVVNIDRSYEGNVLRIGTEEREQGFGLRAPSEMEFVIGKRFSRFRTEYGIDLEGDREVTGERASAEWIQFRVVGDGRRLWSSDWIQWNTKTQPVEVDVTGVEVLKLEVDGGGRRWLFGSAAWGNPVLFRQQSPRK
ncbi:MAG: NPCBM/NEW2 domain-containing protein [Planctomycetes bacterium]|nr:NPCBM/NEW2 domain-containing protein [Planctomycetota bacterium]